MTDRLCATTSRRPSLRWKPPEVGAPAPGATSSAPARAVIGSVAIAAGLLPRAVAVGAAVAGRLGGRHVQRRVAVEEPERLEGEAGVVDGHDGPVLGPGEVRGAEGVPE